MPLANNSGFNRLTVEGHTDALPFGAGERGYSNWELSADRANASRRELVTGGLPDNRVMRVQGLAASVPLERDDPLAPANRRISIIVMNRDAEDRLFGINPDAQTNANTEEKPTQVTDSASAPSVVPSISLPLTR